MTTNDDIPRWWRGGDHRPEGERSKLFFFSPPTGDPAVHNAMATGLIGLIDTPKQSQTPPPGVPWCADNGCFTGKWDSEKWIKWLVRRQRHKDRCEFVTAPDVIGDAAATLELSSKWLPKIHELGYRAAYVAQDGVADVPWELMDVLFIGGTDNFKFSTDSLAVIKRAREHGKRIHFGRINSMRRYRWAEAYGADTADGTILIKAPSENLIRVQKWNKDLLDRPAMFQL
jgi:hypothetical protein